LTWRVPAKILARMFSTVAVGTDGSATAGEAVAAAVEIARRFDAKLVVLSATHGPAPPPDVDPELEWATNSSARMTAILEQLEHALGEQGLEVETRAEEGDPAETLVRLAEEAGAELLVIGNRGMQRRVLGSVPNSVTHKAGCSVLVVKTT
jgi:nucleotide-binding universal stress UspA family protein